MSSPLTRAAAWLVNRCPNWVFPLAPLPVMQEALEQLHTTEARARVEAR